VPQTGVRDRVALGISDARLVVAGNPAPTSLSVRLELWKAGWMLVRERPWTGRDTPAYKQRMRTWVAQGKLSAAVFAPPEPPHLHNDVLQVLVTRGVPGLFAWCGILLAPACFFYRQLGGPRRAMALAGFMIVVAYAGFGLTEVIFWSMKAALFYALTVFLLMGYCLSGLEEAARPSGARAAPAVPEKAPAVHASHPPRPAGTVAAHRVGSAPRWRTRVLRRTGKHGSRERQASARTGAQRRSGCGS
jgi:O-antigen ligase